MKMNRMIIYAALVFSILASHAAFAEIPSGMNCRECGMKVSPDGLYSSYAVMKDGEKRYFCDLGDMLYHFRKGYADASEIRVRDNASGNWTDGTKAYYVKSASFNTPMMWGIAAFIDKADAEKHGKAFEFKDAFGLIK